MLDCLHGNYGQLPRIPRYAGVTIATGEQPRPDQESQMIRSDASALRMNALLACLEFAPLKISANA